MSGEADKKDIIEEIDKRMQTRREAADTIIDVAAEEARSLITDAATRARDLLAVAVVRARELIQTEQDTASALAKVAAEEDRVAEEKLNKGL